MPPLVPGDLLFVYNVDLTPFALVADFVHRLVSPETYPCRLCDLTYDRFTMKEEWKRVVAALPARSHFALRDRFRRAFPACADVPLPAVFRARADGSLATVVSAEEIAGARTVDVLAELVRAAAHR